MAAIGQNTTATIAADQWQYFRLSQSNQLNRRYRDLDGLGDDIDVYTQSSGFPTLSAFDCRSYNGGQADELCTVSLTGDTVVGVYGYRAGTYTLTARPGANTTRSKGGFKVHKGMDVKRVLGADANATPNAVVGTAGGGTLHGVWLCLCCFGLDGVGSKPPVLHESVSAHRFLRCVATGQRVHQACVSKAAASMRWRVAGALPSPVDARRRHIVVTAYRVNQRASRSPCCTTLSTWFSWFR